MVAAPHPSSRSYVILFLWLQQTLFRPVLSDKPIYFNNYGHCQNLEPLDLSDEEYVLEHLGGSFHHETLVCNVTFRAPSKYGVCLKFEELEITDCLVRLNVYRMTSPREQLWRTFDCNNLDSKPNQMCTSERTVKVQVLKSALNYNKGYRFKIEVEKSDNVSDESVLIASIGVFVGIILGVVVLIALLGFSVIYCCCKRKHSRKKGHSPQAEEQNLVQPSAPPLEAPNHPPHLYPHLGAAYRQDLPPPYIMTDAPPPPYESNNQPTLPSTITDEDQTLPLKQ
ncbi:hypothetical protein Btru_038558 [Bulinus truncatus]|nr:hypothetical protein Btru_038558 [Bulinus truncatus]